MVKTAIFYGSSTGNTESVAKRISEKINADLYDVAKKPINEIAEYDNLILGTSTTGIGDLQTDWEDFISDFSNADISGKVIAIFALGDSDSFSDSFVGSMEKIYQEVKNKGCKIVGFTNTDGYEYDESPSIINGQFVGLALDEDNQAELTEERINNWLDQIKQEFK